MAITKVTARLPYFSGLPEDVVTNTFYWASVADPSPTDVDDLLESVEFFYNQGAPTNSLSTYMHPSLSRTSNACLAEAYNMADPTPRLPLASRNFTLDSASGTGKLPLEAAFCLSFKAAYASGQSNARRRGRVYVGPLNDNAAQAGTASAFPTPAAAFQTTLLNAAEDSLFSLPYTLGLFWAVYSTVDNVARNVDEAWVDNAWDTQRRRGNGPTARDTRSLP